MTATSTTAAAAKPSRAHWAIAWAVAALVLFGGLWALNTWMASFGEDAAPVWNCHTMGNLKCGPDSPWHGFYFGPTT